LLAHRSQTRDRAEPAWERRAPARRGALPLPPNQTCVPQSGALGFGTSLGGAGVSAAAWSGTSGLPAGSSTPMACHTICPSCRIDSSPYSPRGQACFAFSVITPASNREQFVPSVITLANRSAGFWRFPFRRGEPPLWPRGDLLL